MIPPYSPQSLTQVLYAMRSFVDFTAVLSLLFIAGVIFLLGFVIGRPRNDLTTARRDSHRHPVVRLRNHKNL